MRLIRSLLAVVAGTALVATTGTPAAADSWERTDIVDQGPGGSVVGAAAIRRQANSVTAQLTMPTPTPGSYEYPQGATASGGGHPEAFSGWMFIFFNPDACDGPCDGTDLMSADPDIIAGGFNVGGHLTAGGQLRISGNVNRQNARFGGPNAESIDRALELGHTIAGAEIHLAIAPHGALDPALMPAAIKTPVGNASFWWIAQFN